MLAMCNVLLCVALQAMVKLRSAGETPQWPQAYAFYAYTWCHTLESVLLDATIPLWRLSVCFRSPSEVFQNLGSVGRQVDNPREMHAPPLAALLKNVTYLIFKCLASHVFLDPRTQECLEVQPPSFPPKLLQGIYVAFKCM